MYLIPMNRQIVWRWFHVCKFTNGSGHEVPACYLELHEEGEDEISTCIWHKYKDMTAI